MPQPSIFPRCSAREALAHLGLALAARGRKWKRGRKHHTPDSYRHSSQIDLFRSKLQGNVYEERGGNAKDRATWSRDTPERRLFGKP